MRLNSPHVSIHLTALPDLSYPLLFTTVIIQIISDPLLLCPALFDPDMLYSNVLPVLQFRYQLTFENLTEI